MNDPVWVEHWDDLEHKLLSEDLCIGVVAGEVMKETPHYPAGIGLPRMHSCRNDHILLVFSLSFGI